MFNGKEVSEIVISQHYQEKHSDHMNDNLILELVQSLDGEFFIPEETKNGFSYFAIEPVLLKKKPYRLVLVTSEKETYLGVINAFRVKRR